MILKDAKAVTKYFYNNMAKNDVLELIEIGEQDENIIPVIKFRNAVSQWVSRLSHSGDLKTTLRGKGILFQSFIPIKTNNKETIVYMGVPRRLSDVLVNHSGTQYLKDTQTKNSYLYTTCTLSILISASDDLPKEIRNLIILYIGQEKIFQLFNPNVNARILTSNLIDILEKKYGILNPEMKSLLLKISNKGVFGGTSDAIQEKLRSEVNKYAKQIKNQTLDLLATKEVRDNLMVIFSRTLDVSSDIFLLFSSPETFFLSKFEKGVIKGIDTIKNLEIMNKIVRTESIINNKKNVLKQNLKIKNNFVNRSRKVRK